MVDDARDRTKVFIDTYVTDANITKDDDTSEASWTCMYAHPNYPLTRLYYNPKNVDGVYFIDTPSTTAIADWKHETYAYDEVVLL